MTRSDTSEAIDAVTRISSAYAARNDVSVDDIVELVRLLSTQFGITLDAGPAPGANRAVRAEPQRSADAAQPAVSLDHAVTQNKVFCLCCGKGFMMLKRHLGSEHGLTEMQYRRRFNLPDEMPLVAPNYSKRKSTYAKQAGFGKHARDTADRDPVVTP